MLTWAVAELAMIYLISSAAGSLISEAVANVSCTAGWEDTAEKARVKAAQAAEEAKVKARQVADASANALSRAMLLGFLALALCGLFAWWGGTLGQRSNLSLG